MFNEFLILYPFNPSRPKPGNEANIKIFEIVHDVTPLTEKILHYTTVTMLRNSGGTHYTIGRLTFVKNLIYANIC